MAARNRSALISKMHKVLKQHYQPEEPAAGERSLVEHLLLACCLENAHTAKAEKTYQMLSTSFFDWNEVRVSTVKELAEAMRDLPDPIAAASNLKRILQTVFESTYSFDLETVKKQNIGVGIKRLDKLEGASPFVVAYATQHGLGGHYIPLDRGAVEVLYIVGIATDAERESGSVAGLERAIPKNKGIAFSSLLHQFAADFVSNPFSPNVKTLLLAINSESKDRLPKRGQKKELAKPAAPVNGHKGGKVVAPVADSKHPAGKSGEKAIEQIQRNGSQKHPAPADHRKPGPHKSEPHPAKKKLPAAKETPAKLGKGKKPAHTATAGSPRPASRKPAGRQLTKRKPR